MNHKLLTICALAALTAGLTGCNEAVDNGLDCSDGTYRAQCVDNKYMMYCDTTTKTEKVKVCEGGYVCANVNGVADCVDLNAPKTDPTPAVCTENATQCNGNFVQTCVNNAWQNAPTACENGCENGACKDAPIVVPDCTEEGAKQCNSDNSNTQTCTNGSWVDDDPACENGCENGACKEAPVEPDCTEEGAKQCNSDNSNTQTCTDGSWVDDDPACENGCENGACIEAPAKDCDEEGAKQCNSSNSNTQTCTDGVWVDDDPACNYGCEEGACKEAPVETECEEEGAVKCAEDTVQTCTGGKWTNADSACEFGCMDGECKLGPHCGDNNIDEGEDCEGENLNGKTCGDVKPMSTGTLACDPTTCKFVADACELPAEGSECDPSTFVESCDGSKVIYCEDGKVVNGSYDCAKYEGRSCVVLDTPDGAWADCMLESDRCETAGTESKGCATSQGYEYSGQFLCVPGSDGNNYNLNVTTEETAMWCGEDEYADAPSCLKDTGECGKLTDDQGSACDSSFVARCDTGEIAVSCDESVVVAEQCDEGLKCVLNDGVPSCLKPCTTSGESKQVCEMELFWGIFELYYSTPQVCTDINGSLYYVSDEENSVSCDHGCDTPDASCLMLSEEEGKECDVESYVPKCDGSDIALTCDDWYDPPSVYAESCSANNSNGAEYVCSEGACVELCTTVGEEYFACDASYVSYGYAPESRRFVCTKSGDINVWVEDKDAYQECESMQCAADGQCRPIVPCDEATFVPRCDGQETVSCVDGMEYVDYDCSKYSGYSCKVIDLGEDGKTSYCFSSADVCTGTDEVLACLTQSSTEYSTVNGCFDADDGKKYLYMTDYTACNHGCDSASGECKKLVADEGDTCVAGEYVERCENGAVAYCSGGKVKALDCTASAGYSCHVLDQDGVPYADCFEDTMKCSDPTETGVQMCYVYGSYGEYTFSHNCYAEIDGDAAYYLADFDADYSACDHGCNTEGTACVKLLDDEGDECSAEADPEAGVSAYVEHCSGNIVAYCSGGKVTALDCSSQSGYTCATADNDGVPYTDCVTAANECTTVGEAVPFCRLYSSYYGNVYGTKTCRAFDDGKNYYISNIAGFCDGSCNAEGTACAE